LTRTWLAGLCVRLLLGAVLRTVVAAFWIASVSLFAQSNAVYYAATLEHNCCMRTFTLVWLVVGGFLLLSPAYAPACPWWDALVMLRAVGFAMMLCLCGALYLLLKVALRFSPCAVPERVVQFLVACGAYNAAPPPDAPAAEHLMPDDKLPRTAFRGAGAGCGKSEPADACVICTENYREGDDVVVLPCGAQKPPTPGGGGAARGTPPGGEGPPHSGGAGAADAVGVALEVVVVVGGGGGGGGAGAAVGGATASTHGSGGSDSGGAGGGGGGGGGGSAPAPPGAFAPHPLIRALLAQLTPAASALFGSAVPPLYPRPPPPPRASSGAGGGEAILALEAAVDTVQRQLAVMQASLLSLLLLCATALLAGILTAFLCCACRCATSCRRTPAPPPPSPPPPPAAAAVAASVEAAPGAEEPLAPNPTLPRA
jgi:hypothetical protein